MRNIVQRIWRWIVTVYGVCLWILWVVVEDIQERFHKPKQPINYANYKRPLGDREWSGKPLDEGKDSDNIPS